jgi:basic membrane protein A
LRKSIRLALLGLALTSGLAACALPGRDCTRQQVLCVGLVTSTARLEDHGLAQSAWQGLQRAVKEGLVQQADVIESVDARDYSKNIAVFAEEGYDLVITSGQGMSEETLEQARLHPDLQFLGLGQDAPAEPVGNLSVLLLPEEQGGFLAGALAAQTSKTGIIGAVCETRGIESMRRYCEGFRAGAAYQSKQVQVMVSYHETGGPDNLFNDDKWGTQTAERMIRDGADVIFGVGGRLGQAALQKASDMGAWSIGSERDQFYITRGAQKSLLTSALPDASEAVYGYLKGLLSGEGAAVSRGRMTLAPYHEGDRSVPLSVQASMLTLQKALEEGTLKISLEESR